MELITSSFFEPDLCVMSAISSITLHMYDAGEANHISANTCTDKINLITKVSLCSLLTMRIPLLQVHFTIS